MKQLLILSGKGGTGKTTITGAFIRLSAALAYADCDVDAPNLHLSLHRDDEPEREDFFGLEKAEIDPSKCIDCGLCAENCRFGAITKTGRGRSVDKFSCEGCGVCEFLCPAKAVSLKSCANGELTLYKSDSSVFSSAALRMGSGASGKLVSAVKDRMKYSILAGTELAIIDGSPGIGCPVIASVSGTDLVLVVAEPSVSGISDMKRVLEVAEEFETDALVCINKFDTNVKKTEEIEAFCREEGIPCVGRIPFDPEVPRVINRGGCLADASCPAGKAVRDIFAKTMKALGMEQADVKAG